jgi:STE24 endopeptidase
MAAIYFYVIVGFILFEFVIERLMDYLDSRYWSPDLPPELRDIYDSEKYQKSQEYERVQTRFGLLTSSFSLMLILVMLAFDGFAWISGIAIGFTDNPILQGLIFFGVLFFASDILGIPFSLYAIFNIEEKFGFNKTTPLTYITDKFKGWLLVIIIGGGILSFIMWIYPLTGSWFWLITWAVLSAFSIFMSMFYSQIIVPLFNKQKPLEEGGLRTAVEEFSAKAGFKLKNIFVIDGSKRSNKANAYFTGLGAKKRIVLYDTLIEKHSTEELVAVLAHEIGHYKKKHTLIGLFSSLASTGLLLFIFSLLIEQPELSAALGAPEPSLLLYGPVSLLLGLIGNAVSRKHEYAADRYAAELYSSEHLQQALIRLSVNNLSNLRPHPLSVFFHYSHPPLLKRLEALKGK